MVTSKTFLASLSFGNVESIFKTIFSSANATPEFEGRGGEQLGSLISNCLSRAYESSQSIDLKQLCIFPEKHCWKIYVDILVSIYKHFVFSTITRIERTNLKILECGGNLFDAISLAVKAALFNTRIPRVEGAVMDGGTVDLKLSDDMFDCIQLNIGKSPILVYLHECYVLQCEFYIFI